MPLEATPKSSSWAGLLQYCLHHPDKVCFLVLSLFVLHMMGIIPEMNVIQGVRAMLAQPAAAEVTDVKK